MNKKSDKIQEDNNIVFGEGNVLTAEGIPLGQCKSFDFTPTPGGLAEMDGFVEWAATFAPISDFPMTTDMEIVDARKWWQWIIPLRTVYVADDVVCGEPNFGVDGSGMGEVEHTFTSDKPFVKEYRWAWKSDVKTKH